MLLSVILQTKNLQDTIIFAKLLFKIRKFSCGHLLYTVNNDGTFFYHRKYNINHEYTVISYPQTSQIDKNVIFLGKQRLQQYKLVVIDINNAYKKTEVLEKKSICRNLNLLRGFYDTASYTNLQEFQNNQHLKSRRFHEDTLYIFIDF